MNKQIKYITILFILVAPILPSFAQEAQLFIGAGIAPLHRTVQSDFKNDNPPFRLFLEYKKSNFSIQAAYSENATYIKNNFSFKHSGSSLSFLYYFKSSFQPSTIVPYLKVGANNKTTKFTTEGYPGISSYEFKIEKDQSVGLDLALGFKYPLAKLLLGLEFNYSKNRNSNFIAGGFSPQSLNSDHLTGELNISIPLKLAGKRKLATTCPNL